MTNDKEEDGRQSLNSDDFSNLGGSGEEEEEEEEEQNAEEEEEEEQNAFSYFDAAAAAMNLTSVSPVSDDAFTKQKSAVGRRGKHDEPDVPIDGQPVLATFGSSSKGSYLPTSRKRSPNRAVNQEYYDVLEEASQRLSQDVSVSEIEEVSSGDEAVRKKKKKKKKSKKKEKRKRQSNKSGDEDDEDGRRRSAVFTSLFPASMVERGSTWTKVKSTFSEKDLIGGKGSDSDDGEDPNDDLPTSGRSDLWNPAALVTAAKSKAPNGKIDQNGFYRSVKGRADTAYEKVHNLVAKKDSIPDNFNLKSIGKSDKKTKPALQRHASIVWGDESERDGSVLNGLNPKDGTTTADTESGGVEMVGECSYSELDEAGENYLASQKAVEKLMRRKKMRQIGILLLAIIAFFSVCFGFYFSRGGTKNHSNQPQPSSNDDVVGRSDPPPRPLPPTPTTTIDSLGSPTAGLHQITLADLHYIVNEITSDASILADPHSPQSKALEWSKNDMKIYNVEVKSRVAQRYCLATLYYATNGTEWTRNTNWGNGHECEWFGVECEVGGSNVVSVTYLDLNSNNLGGSIPPEIGYLNSLEQIHLWGNNLVGSIPDTISKLVNLHTIYLDKNHLDGELGDTFNRLMNLKHLDVSNNQLRGHIPHGLGGLVKLRDLRLSENFLTSTFPRSLISLSNLETLLLDSNALSGPLPSLVGEMRSLVTFRIHENDFRGKLPSFADAKILEEAHFDGNYFSGPVPNFGSTRLRELYLRRNALTGSIPDSIGYLATLEVFSASDNSLNSTIPLSFTNATALEILDLSRNKLTGEIPRGLSKLGQLHELRMDHNRLHGNFPSWLGSLQHLRIIHLNNNLLDGDLELPFNMCELYDLKEFTIQNNDLTGTIGEVMCDLLLDVLSSDCWGSSPRVDCPCCTQCF
ncbi:hypothetical protein ACHAWF_010218 [Thalassiosira exigua]